MLRKTLRLWKWRTKGIPPEATFAPPKAKIITEAEADKLIASGEIDPTIEKKFSDSKLEYLLKPYVTDVTFPVTARTYISSRYIDQLINLLKPLAPDPADIRMVFWFDN